MKTVQATETAVSIWISREQAPSRTQMLALIRQALAERGLTPWPETEAECFAAGEDTLVIARPGHSRRTAWYFADLEALLAGALACPGGDSDLYAVPGGYVLTLAPEAAGPALGEFGESFPVVPEWEIHAREQGMCLIRHSAIDDLRRYFSR